MDPLAEVSNNVSPYHFGLNNPVTNLDPTGMWTETANGYSTNDQSEIAEFFQNVVGWQDPQKQDPDKKKEEEKKRKYEERKQAWEKDKKEYEEKTGKTYHGQSVEEEEKMEESIEQFFYGFEGRLVKVGEEVIVGAETIKLLIIAKKLHLNTSSSTTKEIIKNLDQTVESFISKYRKGSIKSEFPAEFLEQTIEKALNSGNTTVRKLLIDKRFMK
jgi:hypothetical protein